MLPFFQPLPLTRRPQPFSDLAYLYEIKYDGFRALAYCDPTGVRLVSRNGNRFSGFSDLCAGIEFALSLRVVQDDGSFRTLTDAEIGLYRAVLERKYTPHTWPAKEQQRQSCR